MVHLASNGELENDDGHIVARLVGLELNYFIHDVAGDAGSAFVVVPHKKGFQPLLAKEVVTPSGFRHSVREEGDDVPGTELNGCVPQVRSLDDAENCPRLPN